MIKTPIYLDYQATTPVDPRVLERMLPYFSEIFGNPHSSAHAFGWAADEAVEQARREVAALIGAEAREIIFTSGATESNNLAIKGVAHFYGDKKRHIVTCVSEHKCVLETCVQLEREGFEITRMAVGRNGLIDREELRHEIRDDTLLVSIMAANNEIGVLQPIGEVGALCREKGIFFHTDSAQAAGTIPLDVHAMNIDLMSLSAHKLYGPMGIGALYVRRRPRVRLLPLMDGGGQERGLRSGTLAPALCVGFGEACTLAAREMEEEAPRLRALRDFLLTTLVSRLEGVVVNGDRDKRLPGNLNVSFAGTDASDLLARLGDVAMATGSACSSASIEPSYVLRALGLSDAEASASLRIGLGRFTTEEEIIYACDRIIAAVTAARTEALTGILSVGSG